MLTFPEGASLYFHTFAYPRLALVWLGAGIFGSERETLIVLHNVTHLLSFPLSGLGAYLLVRKFTGEPLSALAGGFVFAFNPSHVQHALHHVGITSIEFFPFFALFYWQAIERRSAVWLAAAVLCMAMASLSSLYYFFYCGYFMLFHMAAMAWRERALPRGWSLAAPVLTGLAVLMLLMPLVIPMMRQMTSGDFSYPPGHATFVIDLAAYALFSPHHVFGPLTGPFYRFILHGNPWEAAGYLGLANITLFVWIWNNRNDSQDWLLRYCLAGMLFFGRSQPAVICAFSGSPHFQCQPCSCLNCLSSKACARPAGQSFLSISFLRSALALRSASPCNALARKSGCNGR